MRWLPICLLLLLAWDVAAQSTGGSFGGGSFDEPAPRSGSTSSGSNPGSDWGAGSGSPSDPWPPSSSSPLEVPGPSEEGLRLFREQQEQARLREAQWRAQHREAGIPDVTAEERETFKEPSLLVRLLWPHGLFGVGVWLLMVFVRIKPSSKDAAPSPRPAFLSGFAHLATITVAFDWKVRRSLQQQLRRLAESMDMSSPGLRQVALQKVVSALEQKAGSARYARWNLVTCFRANAQRTFVELAKELRGRYQHDLMRSTIEEEDLDLRARSREGEGLVVVTLIVGRSGLARPFRRSVSEDGLRRVLDQVAPGDGVNVLEIIWSPAAEADRMSSAELEVVYPELVPIEGRTGSLGRVSCPSCKTVYAAELGECPGCGDPAPGAAAKHEIAGPCPYCAAEMPRYETKCEACGAWVAADGSKQEEPR